MIKLKKLLSISLLNFKEATRDKLFSGVIFFFIFYLFFCMLLGKLAPGHTDKVLRDAGLAGIELTSIILIIFSFTMSFFKEKEARLMEVYLTNYSPCLYISGKICGYLFIGLFYLLSSAIAYCFVLSFFGAANAAVLAAFYPLFLKLSMMFCFVCLFSCFFSTATVALLCSLFFYAASELAPIALKIVTINGTVHSRFFVELIYTLLPNMDKLDIKALAAYGKLPPAEYFFWITAYVFSYILCLWIINLFIFQKKEY